jgi:hypothetical protein
MNIPLSKLLLFVQSKHKTKRVLYGPMPIALGRAARQQRLSVRTLLQKFLWLGEQAWFWIALENAIWL